ncbi:MAG: hypothetical protein KDC93_11845 [Cyclobacteriaceae bacterium]|nr:hypothetical protein [Cyclobacteriaceae bacterium]
MKTPRKISAKLKLNVTLNHTKQDQVSIEFTNLIHASISRPLHFIERSLAVSSLISEHRVKLNAAKEYMSFFGYTQLVYNEQLMITLARMYDIKKRKYKTNCIEATLMFMQENIAELPPIKNREKTFRCMLEHDFTQDEIDGVKNLDDQAITRLVMKHYSRWLKKDATLAQALKRLKNARNKQLAHSEDDTVLKFETPTFDDVKLLIHYAKNFFIVISMIYYDITMSLEGEYNGTKAAEAIKIPTSKVINDLLNLRESGKSKLL